MNSDDFLFRELEFAVSTGGGYGMVPYRRKSLSFTLYQIGRAFDGWLRRAKASGQFEEQTKVDVTLLLRHFH